MIRRYCLALVLMSLALVSCAADPDKTVSSQQTGGVQARVMDTPTSERYEETDNVVYLPPVPAADNSMPEYPAGLLPSRLPPTMISVRLIVNAAGVVSDVQSLDTDRPDSRPFLPAYVRPADAGHSLR